MYYPSFNDAVVVCAHFVLMSLCYSVCGIRWWSCSESVEDGARCAASASSIFFRTFMPVCLSVAVALRVSVLLVDQCCCLNALVGSTASGCSVPT